MSPHEEDQVHVGISSVNSDKTPILHTCTSQRPWPPDAVGNAFQSFLSVITSIHKSGNTNCTPCSGIIWTPSSPSRPYHTSEQGSHDNSSLARLISGLPKGSVVQDVEKLEPEELFSEAAGQVFLVPQTLPLKFYFPDWDLDNLAEKWNKSNILQLH